MALTFTLVADGTPGPSGAFSDGDNTSPSPVGDGNRVSYLQIPPRNLQVRYGPVRESALAGLRFAQTVVVEHHGHNATLGVAFVLGDGLCVEVH
jgi:hypothetical protein